MILLIDAHRFIARCATGPGRSFPKTKCPSHGQRDSQTTAKIEISRGPPRGSESTRELTNRAIRHRDSGLRTADPGCKSFGNRNRARARAERQLRRCVSSTRPKRRRYFRYELFLHAAVTPLDLRGCWSPTQLPLSYVARSGSTSPNTEMARQIFITVFQGHPLFKGARPM